jgi:hypothetical protein
MIKFMKRLHAMKAKHPGRIERSYESFLEQPVAVVLVLLWLAGVVLLSSCAAALYSYWLLLQAVA